MEKHEIEKQPFKVSEAQRRATKKYNENASSISIRINPEQKEQWDNHVQRHGESLRAFIIRSCNEQMKRDNATMIDIDALLADD